MDTQEEVKRDGDPTSTTPLNERRGDHTLDSLFEGLGQCGRFQAIFMSLGVLPPIFLVWGLVFMFFGSYDPGWRCMDEPDLPLNSSAITSQEISSVYTGNVSECDRMRACRNLSINTIASTIVTEWGLYCDYGWVSSLIASIQMAGVTLGSLVAGQLGDKFGRKLSVYGSVLLVALGSLIGIYSVSWQMYAVIRFVVGLGCGGSFASNNVYISEFITAKWRAFLGVFPFWNIGSMTFGLCVMGLKNWKQVHIATAIVLFLAFLPVFWLPESLRLCTVNGDLQRGYKIVEKIARLNGKSVPDTSIMRIVSEAERENLRSRPTYTYWDLFQKSVRKCTVVMGLLWFSVILGYYMIGFGLGSLSGDFFVNLLLLSVISAPLKLVSVVVTANVGRKITLATLVFLSSVCSFSVVGIQFLASAEDKPTLTTIMAFGLSMMLESAAGVVIVFTVELYPTPIRNLGYGFCSAAGKFAAIVAPFIVAKGILPMYGSYLLLASILLISLCGLLTLPETMHRPLLDIVQTKPNFSRSKLQEVNGEDANEVTKIEKTQ